MHDNKILVVRGWLGPNHWSLPGGGLHRNEEAKAGTIRELREETGLQIKAQQLHLLGRGTATTYGLRYNYVSFWLELTNILPVRPSRLEVVEVAWLRLEELTTGTAAKDTMLIVDQWLRQR
jgi:8-oxo-dGTP pyrophosphatase MutT (NUDIX family)